MRIKRHTNKIISSFVFFFASTINADVLQIITSPGISDTQQVEVSSLSSFRAYFHENRSYECSISNTLSLDSNEEATNNASYFTFLSTVLNKDLNPVSVNFNGSVYPPIPTVKGMHPSKRITKAQQGRQRFSLIAAQAGEHTASAENIFDPGGASYVLFSCRETTLYGSYNRFYAETPIIELLNRARVPFRVEVTIVGGDGNILINKQPHTVNANTRTDIIFNGLPANSLGQIIINHTAPFGALEGTIAEYNQGATGNITLRRERPLEIAERS